MLIGIYGQLTANTDVKKLQELLSFLRERKVAYSIYAPFAETLKDTIPASLLQFVFNDFREITEYNYLFSIGGDGTFLKAIRGVALYGIPVVGINTGRLGFLASFPQDNILKVAESVIKEQVFIEERTLLEIECNKPEIFGDNKLALNEITFHKSNSNEMIVIDAFINGEFLNSYWADGLIVSTPTGSTAYSLSCGGPIIHPKTNVLVLTPIAPHSLTVRPFVISDDVLITFEIKTRSKQAYVALDNKTFLVPNEIEIAVKKSRHTAKFVKTPYAPTFIETIRKRLHWGKDVRNRT